MPVGPARSLSDVELSPNEDLYAVRTPQLQPQGSVISLKRDLETKERATLAFPGNPLRNFRECDHFALQSKCIAVWKFPGFHPSSRQLARELVVTFSLGFVEGLRVAIKTILWLGHLDRLISCFRLGIRIVGLSG